MAQPQQAHTGFLSLPAELRNRIYDNVLPHATDIYPQPEPALLQATRLIRSETLPMYYGANVFCLCMHSRHARDECLRWWDRLGAKAALVRRLRIATNRSVEVYQHFNGRGFYGRGEACLEVEEITFAAALAGGGGEGEVEVEGRVVGWFDEFVGFPSRSLKAYQNDRVARMAKLLQGDLRARVRVWEAGRLSRRRRCASDEAAEGFDWTLEGEILGGEIGTVLRRFYSSFCKEGGCVSMPVDFEPNLRLFGLSLGMRLTMWRGTVTRPWRVGRGGFYLT